MDRGESSAVGSYQDPEEMETNVQSRARRLAGLGDSEAGDKSNLAAKNMLEWGNEIRIGDVGFSVLGTAQVFDVATQSDIIFD